MVRRKSLPYLIGIPLFCAALSGLVWTYVHFRLESDKASIEKAAYKEASGLAASYAEQLVRTVDQIDQLLRSTAYYWNKSGGKLDFRHQATDGLYPSADGFFLGVFDKNGDLADSVGSRAEKINIADRPHFHAHKKSVSAALHIAPFPVGRVTNKPRVVFSRPVRGNDGDFGGIVSIGVYPAFLASFYSSIAHGKSDLLAVATKDGNIIASRIGESLQVASPVTAAQFTFDNPSGTAALPEEAFADRRSRIVAWKALEKYPLVSVVALAEDDIYAAHVATRREYVRMAAATTAIFALMALLGVAFSGMMVWRRMHAEKISNTYRLATDGAREGFFMVRALQDASGATADFVIEDCNQRGADFFKLPRERVIGKSLSRLFPKRDAQPTIEACKEAMRLGFYEDEDMLIAGESQERFWFHRRMVRASDGDGLAVTVRDITETKAHQESLTRLANSDALTELPNRHWLTCYLPEALKRARAGSSKLAILFIDLDDFKNVNNTMGHAAGDELLRIASGRMKSVLRPADNVVRLGGDEFTVILENIGSEEEAASVASRINAALCEPFVINGTSASIVHASIGISIYPDDGEGMEALLQHADIAMYAAKNSGKGQFRFYEAELTDSVVSRVNKEKALRQAIELDQFVLHYQPRVDTQSGEMRSMEALVRWMHPEQGMIPPLEFIPVAEETGLIIRIGEMVLEKACAQLAAWRREGVPVVPISVNVSPKQFGTGGLSRTIAACLARHRIPASLLEIEITESCMMGDSERIALDLAALKALGIGISVDDFGTGYSSLSQLQRLDLDVLKVDRAFTRELDGGRHGEAFFMTIVSMAHILGMRVVAEGVETMAELRILQALSCNEAQGYLISKPVPADAASALLRKRFLFPQPGALKAVS